jgi:hypothetical protein
MLWLDLGEACYIDRITLHSHPYLVATRIQLDLGVDADAGAATTLVEQEEEGDEVKNAEDLQGADMMPEFVTVG